ncbi:MAG TPA: FecR domain-containing protein [Mucilaginibacter sp.]|jgi:hypothetical protein
MEDNKDRIIILLSLYAEDSITRKELDELMAYISDAKNDQVLHTFMLAEWENLDTGRALPEPDWDNMLVAILRPAPAKVRTLSWLRYVAAASILIAVSVGGYFLLHQPPNQQLAQNNELIAPVQKGVTLSLANGKQIAINKKYIGQLTNVSGAKINQQDSSLSYHGNGGAVEMNTLTNNGSSKFSVTLADGTEATLDIGSSLTYPVAFNTNIRKVSMTGQAYFKVKHIEGQRFIVSAQKQITEDIGTEFNINAYDDESAVKTTLIDGSIKVNDRLLKPGQQAVISAAGLDIKTADIESVTAWLQGKLIFEKEPLENILKRIARIYGVQIVYQDEEVKKYTYFGSVNSTKKLASVLNFFRKAGRVDFTVEGKTVKVFKTKKQLTNH